MCRAFWPPPKPPAPTYASPASHLPPSIEQMLLSTPSQIILVDWGLHVVFSPTGGLNKLSQELPAISGGALLAGFFPLCAPRQVYGRLETSPNCKHMLVAASAALGSGAQSRNSYVRSNIFTNPQKLCLVPDSQNDNVSTASLDPEPST